jgi:hypothetical protein
MPAKVQQNKKALAFKQAGEYLPKKSKINAIKM